MAWRLPVDKPLSEPMTVNLLTPICLYASLDLNELTECKNVNIYNWRHDSGDKWYKV